MGSHRVRRSGSKQKEWWDLWLKVGRIHVSLQGLGANPLPPPGARAHAPRRRSRPLSLPPPFSIASLGSWQGSKNKKEGSWDCLFFALTRRLPKANYVPGVQNTFIPLVCHVFSSHRLCGGWDWWDPNSTDEVPEPPRVEVFRSENAVCDGHHQERVRIPIPAS